MESKENFRLGLLNGSNISYKGRKNFRRKCDCVAKPERLCHIIMRFVGVNSAQQTRTLLDWWLKVCGSQSQEGVEVRVVGLRAICIYMSWQSVKSVQDSLVQTLENTPAANLQQGRKKRESSMLMRGWVCSLGS